MYNPECHSVCSRLGHAEQIRALRRYRKTQQQEMLAKEVGVSEADVSQCLATLKAYARTKGGTVTTSESSAGETVNAAGHGKESCGASFACQPAT